MLFFLDHWVIRVIGSFGFEGAGGPSPLFRPGFEQEPKGWRATNTAVGQDGDGLDGVYRDRGTDNVIRQEATHPTHLI